MVKIKTLAKILVRAIRRDKKDRKETSEQRERRLSEERTRQISEFLGYSVDTWRPEPTKDRPLSVVRAMRDSGQQVTDSELHMLAAAEDVYLIPPSSRLDRFYGEDHGMRGGLVARLHGPDHHGWYIFLTTDRTLLKCRNSQGKGRWSGMGQVEAKSYREIALRYWNERA
ncbi:hypothetical protein F5Y18DRAFT_413393 [Xylariaceae sp. FL1019]|nr:hypothetical protein F5Y18DRAFT_413393 [Xylariaceae sp. FL1019]